jgi:hypothetical protein
MLKRTLWLNIKGNLLGTDGKLVFHNRMSFLQLISLLWLPRPATLKGQSHETEMSNRQSGLM